MEAFQQHLQAIILKQQSFEPAAQVAAGAVGAIAHSTQWPVDQRVNVLDHLEAVIVETRDSLKSEQSTDRVNEARSSNHANSRPASPLRARASVPIFKCMVYGSTKVGKTTWLDQAKMQLEAFEFSTPSSPFSREIIYRTASGPLLHFSLWEISPLKSIEEQEALRAGSHVSFVLYDSSSEQSAHFAGALVTHLSSSSPSHLIFLIDNRPPYGQPLLEPQPPSSSSSLSFEHVIISTAKKSNILQPLQLAARKLLNDAQFSFDPKVKLALTVPDFPPPTLSDPPTLSSAPNPATIAAAAASTSSSHLRATPASWNAKKASSSMQRGDKKLLLSPPQPLSPYATWELEHRSSLRRKYPHVSSAELDRKLRTIWRTVSDVERERYGLLALRARRLFAEGLARDLGAVTSPQPTSSDEDSL